MPNRAYVNAAAMERRAAQRLRDEGWTVWRTPGSKSRADIVAIRGLDEWSMAAGPIRRARVALVQAKGGAATMTKKAKAEFADYAEALGAEAWLCERGMVFTRIPPSGGGATEAGSGIGD